MNDPVAEFVAEARRCCALIENEQRGAASAFEKECLVALLRLYEQYCGFRFHRGAHLWE